MCNFERKLRRQLTIAPDFVPYMEKHGLYEFFYELVTQLVIQQPDDIMVFMKQCIDHAIRKRDIPRVILITPPNFDKMALAKILQTEISVRPITLEDLRAFSQVEPHSTRESKSFEEPDEVAICMKKMLMSGVFHETGWVLVDLPRNKMDARALQRVGVIPTHVIQIVLSKDEKDKTQGTINTTFRSFRHISCLSKNDASQQENKRILRGLREAYTNFLVEIETGTRTIQELGKACAALTKIRRHRGAPSLFRIVLIGPRGSSCRSLAKHLSQRFNLVHIDFNNIVEQARFQETYLDEMLRFIKHTLEQEMKPKDRIQIVEKYVLQVESLKRGWILIGYPTTVEDFKLLDMISTPPNRVIILEVDGQICRERLMHCRCDIDTGSDHNLISGTSQRLKDHSDIIEQYLQTYEDNVRSIRQYAGETACVIDANSEKKIVRERVEICLMRPAPRAKPRIPQPPVTIDPMDIEYDPDGPPDLSVFDEIRAPEPKFSFI